MRIFMQRNFLFMFIGRVITNIGDSFYTVAAMWLVYDLGGSTFYTGLAGFLTILPRCVQFFSGPLIDRIPIRSLLLYSQIFQGILLLIIPTAHYFNFLSITLVLIITPLVTTLNMFVYPAQMASLPKFVKEKDLTKANSYFTLAYQGIEIGCNAVAGILIVMIGAISIYLLDSVLFMVGAILFSFLRISKDMTENHEKRGRVSIFASLKIYKDDLKIGIDILLSKPLLRILIGVIAINLVGGATFVVLPEFSEHSGGPEIYGLLLMAQAAGSLSGALLAPYLKVERFGLGKVYSLAFLISGFMWALSVFSPWTWLMIVIYGIAWLPGGVTNILINTCLQKGVPKHLLGRVFSASYSLSGIAMPLGSLLGGYLGVMFGSIFVIFCSGLVIFLVGIFWMVDKTTRSLPKTENINESTFIQVHVS
ncbi:MFS transporter [Bacillus sp. JJ1521]|uniref:MFS transporter n=1 Tax=Bacillus sp. JJ1521 TaxID=3122957 RepID=UPI002FFDD15A